MTISYEAVITILEKGGLFAVCIGLVYVIYGLVVGKVVVRPWHDDIVNELRRQIAALTAANDKLTHLAYRGTELAERSMKTQLAPDGEKK